MACNAPSIRTVTAMADALFVLGYEGTDGQVADFAAWLAKRQAAELLVVHVIEWSPYAFLTPEELAERHKVRQAELQGAEQRILAPLLARLRTDGINATGEVRHGKPVDVLCAIAKDRNAQLIIAGRSNALSERVFGGVASGLSQCASVPVVIVP
jgi:nucleotide-binding universal stress UspA family protein